LKRHCPKKIFLPDECVNVPAVSCKTDHLCVPELACADSVAGFLETGKAEEKNWFQQFIQLLKKDNLMKEDYTSWAAFHASLQSTPINPAAIIALLLYYMRRQQHFL